MKTFNMYVKTVIRNEEDKILLLKQKREDEKQRWDLPGSTFTEEQSFDETVITNVQKEIGFYVYPGKIIGISDLTSNTEKDVYVIMEGTILNGELLLSKDYETFTWVNLSRIKEYPLAPWLHNYIHNTKHPFEDIESEIEELTKKRRRRRDFFQEDTKSTINPKSKTEKSEKKEKSSFSILKETILKTFHPREAKVTQTTPKTNSFSENTETEENEIESQLNFRKRKDEPDKEYIEEAIKNSDNDIIIEHDEDTTSKTDMIINQKDVVQEDIIIEHDTEDIIIEHDTEYIIIEHDSEDNKYEVKENLPEKTIESVEKDSDDKKIFDMNVNKQDNMKENIHKEKPEIKIIRKDEKTPHIRTEKEEKEKVSFNSDIRHGWKERLNRINRTDANKNKKEAPRPKGQRK